MENEAPSMRTEGASEHSGGAIALLAPATTALILRRKRASEIDGAVLALEVGVEISPRDRAGIVSAGDSDGFPAVRGSRRV
jgi:hypothetical protein